MSREELRQLAEAATPGPWEFDEELGEFLAAPVRRGGLVFQRTSFVYADEIEDARFIAAANPAAVLALLDERDALADRIERVRALHFGEYVEDEDRNRCFECGDDWPCPTVRALDGEADR